jgi:hypothetical protein
MYFYTSNTPPEHTPPERAGKLVEVMHCGWWVTAGFRLSTHWLSTVNICSRDNESLRHLFVVVAWASFDYEIFPWCNHEDESQSALDSCR